MSSSSKLAFKQHFKYGVVTACAYAAGGQWVSFTINDIYVQLVVNYYLKHLKANSATHLFSIHIYILAISI